MWRLSALGLVPVAIIAVANDAPPVKYSNDPGKNSAQSRPNAISSEGQDKLLVPDVLDELRRNFTVGGRTIPPLIFRDLGDGNEADTKSMLITADVKAAIGGNQYSGLIKREEGFVVQSSEASEGSRAVDTEAYRFLGATPDGLLVVLTNSSSSDGHGSFYHLHVLDASVTAAIDYRGRKYERVTVTTLQLIPVGDRWAGQAKLSGDIVTITRPESGPGFPQNERSPDKLIRIVRP